MAGLPGARRAFAPRPVRGRSAAELRAYVEGADPITGRPVMQEVIEGLTAAVPPVTLDALHTTPRLVEPATEASLQRLFLENDWPDRVPIVLPTAGRGA